MSNKNKHDEDARWDSYEDGKKKRKTMVRLKPGVGAKYQRTGQGLKFEDFIISIEED